MTYILLFIIRLPKLILNLILNLRYIRRLKKYSESPFICPICGKKFYTKWYKLWFWGETSIIVSNKALLKCLHCGTKDRCTLDSSENADRGLQTGDGSVSGIQVNKNNK